MAKGRKIKNGKAGMGQADILSGVKIGSAVIRAAMGLEIVGLNQVLRGEMAVVAGYAAHLKSPLSIVYTQTHCRFWVCEHHFLFLTTNSILSFPLCELLHNVQNLYLCSLYSEQGLFLFLQSLLTHIG